MDEIERRIRQARPVSGHRDLPLTDRAKRELGELIIADGAQEATRRVTLRRRRRVWLLVPAAVATAAVAVVVGTIVLRPTTTPEAFTPTPLATDTSGDALGLMPDASDETLSDALNTSFAYRTWELDDSSPDVIAPQVHTVRLEEDGTRTETVTAAQPTSAPGSSTEGTPPAGTLLSERHWEPGAFTSPYLEPLPDDASRVGAYLESAAGSGSPLTGSEALRAIESLIVVDRLNSAQTLALVDYLSGLADVALTGSVVDREGRDGVAFAATATDERGEVPSLIVAPDGERVLGFEVVYEGDAREDLHAPAVVAYTVWLDDRGDE